MGHGLQPQNWKNQDDMENTNSVQFNLTLYWSPKKKEKKKTTQTVLTLKIFDYISRNWYRDHLVLKMWWKKKKQFHVSDDSRWLLWWFDMSMKSYLGANMDILRTSAWEKHPGQTYAFTLPVSPPTRTSTKMEYDGMGLGFVQWLIQERTNQYDGYRIANNI